MGQDCIALVETVVQPLVSRLRQRVLRHPQHTRCFINLSGHAVACIAAAI